MVKEVEQRQTEGLYKFYFTFGFNPDFPFQGGWIELYAVNRQRAVERFKAIFKPSKGGYVNCGDIYSEAEFMETVMWLNERNQGNGCHGVIFGEDVSHECQD